jgi:hypothetical protein
MQELKQIKFLSPKKREKKQIKNFYAYMASCKSFINQVKIQINAQNEMIRGISFGRTRKTCISKKLIQTFLLRH